MIEYFRLNIEYLRSAFGRSILKRTLPSSIHLIFNLQSLAQTDFAAFFLTQNAAIWAGFCLLNPMPRTRADQNLLSAIQIGGV